MNHFEGKLVDNFKLGDATKSASTPAIHGILFENIKDDYGKTVLKKVDANVVTVGGAVCALEHLCGVDASWRPATLNSIYNVNTDVRADPLVSTVMLFGIGNGGCGLDFGSTVAKNEKLRDIPGHIPMRVSADLTGTTDANRYFLKVPNHDGTYSFYLKEFATLPAIKTLWKDAADNSSDGTEVTDEIWNSSRTEGLQTFAEFNIDLNELDGYEYYESISGLSGARYNSIGLYLGNKVLLSDGSYDYVNVRLFSYLNFGNRDISEKCTASYTYRILTLV